MTYIAKPDRSGQIDGIVNGHFILAQITDNIMVTMLKIGKTKLIRDEIPIEDQLIYHYEDRELITENVTPELLVEVLEQIDQEFKKTKTCSYCKGPLGDKPITRAKGMKVYCSPGCTNDDYDRLTS